MIKKALIAAIASSFGACAFAQPAAPPGGPRPAPFAQAKAEREKSPDCARDAPQCTITIKVGKGCDIRMSHDVFVVAPHPKGVEMIWKLEGDAAFAKQNPIEFKGADFAPMRKKGYTDVTSPRGVFLPSRTKRTWDPAKEHHKFNAGKPGQYYYVVNVVQDGKACPEYDPGVINQ